MTMQKKQKKKKVKLQQPPRSWGKGSTPVPKNCSEVRIIKPEQTDVYIASKEFLISYEWRQLRYKALKRSNGTCACCGNSPKKDPDCVLNVDHIKPRKYYPKQALDIENLQVLCHDCNHGKGNSDQTRW